MKKIKHFERFVNENYSYLIGEGIFSGLSDRAGEFLRRMTKLVKNGIIKLIPGGMKQGYPMIGYFPSWKGNILNQLHEFFSGSDYLAVSSAGKNPIRESRIYEAGPAGEEAVISKYLSDPGNWNIGSVELKQEIINRYEGAAAGGYDKVIFIFGAPGIGKTEIVAQAAQELGVDLMFLDVQYMEPSDFLGIPKVIELANDEAEENPYGKGVTRFNPPTTLPQKGSHPKGGILFLDEMNRARSSTFSSVMQFIQQKRIQNYTLPPGWILVAAGNRKSDDLEENIITIGSASVDRFDFYNYVPTVEGFEEYVMGVSKSGSPTASSTYTPKGTMGRPLSEVVLPELMAFLKFSPQWFHTLTPQKVLQGEKFASPRAWIDASKHLFTRMQQIKAKTGSVAIDDRELEKIFTVAVGPGAAKAFIKFLSVVKKFAAGDINKVWDDPANAPYPSGSSDVETRWAIIAAATAHIDKIGANLTVQQFSNGVDWATELVKRLGKENGIEFAQAFMVMVFAKAPYTKDKKYIAGNSDKVFDAMEDVIKYMQL